jgi:hypothetical protein
MNSRKKVVAYEPLGNVNENNNPGREEVACPLPSPSPPPCSVIVKSIEANDMRPCLRVPYISTILYVLGSMLDWCRASSSNSRDGVWSWGSSTRNPSIGPVYVNTPALNSFNMDDEEEVEEVVVSLVE